MAKVNPYTEDWLKKQGMTEISKGVYQKKNINKTKSLGDKPPEIECIKHPMFEESYLEKRIDSKKQIIKINMKPMSVNGAWQGRRFKSKEYIAYTDSCMSILPNITLPEPPYRINFEFGVSNPASDWDNPVKPIQDILQKRYKFNDKDIYEAFVKKVIVPKRHEYFSFELIHI